jgi:hypothetical protein
MDALLVQSPFDLGFVTCPRRATGQLVAEFDWRDVRMQVNPSSAQRRELKYGGLVDDPRKVT